MSKRCKGCGVVLQSEDENALGYTPNLEKDYCKRCFRITHYDDVVISMKQGIDPDVVLSKIETMQALVVWVVDLFDFEASLVKGINRHLIGKDIIMVATKRDLLPDTMGNEKISQFILRRLKEEDIVVKGIVLCSDLAKHAFDKDNHSLEEVKHAIDYYRDGRDVAIMGMANAGKSTLINGLLNNQKHLTTSRHPGTTLDVVEIPYEDYTLYDTPGLTRQDSLLSHIDDNQLSTVIPDRPLKARIYQLRGDQSMAAAGFARLDLFNCENVSCVCYFAMDINVHRSKAEKADELWEKHMGELLAPSLGSDVHQMKKFTSVKFEDKLDVVIHGLGWFCISGEVDRIDVYVPKQVNVTFRKAMI